MIDYIVSWAISFTGIILGGILATIAPEELRSGEKYLKVFEWVVLAVAIVAIFYFLRLFWLAAVIFSGFLIFIKIIKHEYYFFPWFLLLAKVENFLFLASSLIFIYGLAYGTLEAKQLMEDKKIKNKIKINILIFKNNLLYFIYGFLVLLSILLWPFIWHYWPL